MESIARETL